MSTSPSTSNDHFDQPSGKRRRTTSFSLTNAYPAPDNRDMVPQQQQTVAMGHPTQPPPSSHIPKRGARACTNCRKGKNRCEGEVSVFHFPPSSSLPPFRCSMARPLRPARLTLHPTGSMSTMPVEWDTVRVRKAREEEYPGHV